MRALVLSAIVIVLSFSQVNAQAPCSEQCILPKHCIYSKKIDVGGAYCGETSNLNLRILLEKFDGSFSFRNDDGQEVTVTTEKPDSK